MSSITLDQKDKKLLSLLTGNARLPVAVLARELDLSRTAVHHRLEKLEKHGIILGYTLKVKNTEDTGVQAVATITLKSGSVADLRSSILHLTEVRKVWSLAGNIDVYVLLESATIDELYAVINAIGKTEIIKRMSSHIVLEQLLDR